MRKWVFCLALTAAVAGCVQTSEMPLAENVDLIQGSGTSGGWIADMIVADQLPKQTLRQVVGNQVMLSGGNPINRTTTSVMVVMFREAQPGAIDARAVLAAKQS